MKKNYLVISILLVVLGCEKEEEFFIEDLQDDSPQEQSLESPSNLRYIKAKEIPKVLHVLESHLGKADKSLNSIVYKKSDIDLNALIDLTSILEVLSTGKRTNYTFPLELEGQPENEFYNIIIHKTASGNIRKPYVKRYRVDPDALESYNAHNRDFRYFKGTFSNHWLDDFFNAFDNEGGKYRFKAVSTCDDGGTIGGGGTYNPNLIDVNNDVTWNGLGQTGYGRALGTWNHYGGTGGYDLGVRVRNNSTGYTEVSNVSSITSNSVVISTGYSSFTVNVYSNHTWIDVTTETTGSSGSTGGGCTTTTIIRGTDGGKTVEVGDCLSAQKSSEPNIKSSSSCPGDDGEVGVIDSSIIKSISKKLGLAVSSPEFIWLMGDLSEAEQQQVNILNLYLINNTTPEAKMFGLEILRTLMIEDGSLIIAFPFFKYPPGSTYASDYPKLTEYLQNKMPLVKDMPAITSAIQDITNLSLSQIQEDLQWGKGPIIVIQQLDNYPGSSGIQTVGLFDSNNPDTLYLDVDWVNNLENDNYDENLVEYFGMQANRDAFLFFLGTTILHEYVHYGDYVNGNFYGISQEEGDMFETRVYGEDVNSGTLLFKTQ